MWPLNTEIQPLGKADIPAIRLHLMALSPDDRYSRFGMPLSDDALHRWMQSIQWSRQAWWGAWLNPDMGLVGVVQLVRTHQTGAWELALSVSEPARHHGIGTLLLSTAIGRGPEVKRLIGSHGHMAVRIMAKRLGLHLESPAHQTSQAHVWRKAPEWR